MKRMLALGLLLLPAVLAQAEAAADTPACTRPDNGLVVEATFNDFEAGYRAARGIMNRAMQAGMMEALDAVVQSRPDSGGALPMRQALVEAVRSLEGVVAPASPAPPGGATAP
jgi:hypothetical protein